MTNEKEEEKDREKREEKSPQEKAPEEKSWDEKSRRDPLNSIVWACIFIWAGLVFLASNIGWLTFRSIPGLPAAFSPEPWSVVMIGAGVIVLIEVVIRLLVPEYRRPVGGSLVLAAVFLGIGLGNFIGWNIVWAFILIALGISVLLRGFWHRK